MLRIWQEAHGIFYNEFFCSIFPQNHFSPATLFCLCSFPYKRFIFFLNFISSFFLGGVLLIMVYSIPLRMIVVRVPMELVLISSSKYGFQFSLLLFGRRPAFTSVCQYRYYYWICQLSYRSHFNASEVFVLGLRKYSIVAPLTFLVISVIWSDRLHLLFHQGTYRWRFLLIFLNWVLGHFSIDCCYHCAFGCSELYVVFVCNIVCQKEYHSHGRSDIHCHESSLKFVLFQIIGFLVHISLAISSFRDVRPLILCCPWYWFFFLVRVWFVFWRSGSILFLLSFLYFSFGFHFRIWCRELRPTWLCYRPFAHQRILCMHWALCRLCLG